jgi:hypothetical protein
LIASKKGMKALLELASLFQVIPKPSQAPWQGGRGWQGEWEEDCSPPLSNCGIMFCNINTAADGYGNAHKFNTENQLILPSLAGQAEAWRVGYSTVQTH